MQRLLRVMYILTTWCKINPQPSTRQNFVTLVDGPGRAEQKCVVASGTKQNFLTFARPWVSNRTYRRFRTRYSAKLSGIFVLFLRASKWSWSLMSPHGWSWPLMCFAWNTFERSGRADHFLHTANFQIMFLTCFIVSYTHACFDFNFGGHKIALLKCMCTQV